MNDNILPDGINYKINERGVYTVSVTNYGDKTFYNVELTQKKLDGTKATFKRQISFWECDPPENGAKIRIKRGFESNYPDPKNKYNWVTTIVIQDYDIVPESELDTGSAFLEYQEKISENGEVNINDDMLPF